MALQLVSDTVKTQASAALDNVHDTFGRTITAYKDAEQNIIAVTPEYNSIYGSAGSNSLSITNTVVSGEFSARIKKYTQPSEEFFQDSQLNSQVKIPLPEGVVRIKVDPAGFNFIKDAKRIEFDGNRYIILNDGMPKTIGPFGAKYYAFYLSPIDEDA